MKPVFKYTTPKRLKFKYAYPAPRQVGGDDGYQYVVFVRGSQAMNGLSRTEASYYRLMFENEERQAAGEELLTRS